jgi:methyl-accepting chemotaxis protein
MQPFIFLVEGGLGGTVDRGSFLAVTSRGMEDMSMVVATHTSMSTGDPRSRFFVHRIQKGYAAWIGLLLFLYSALFFTMAFYGAHLKPVVALYTSDSLEERQVAAEEMLALSQTIWVAVPVLFFGSVIFSLIVTRRVAGPLARLDESLQQWARGNLRWRMRFRPSDRLDELADHANCALENIERSFDQIQHQTRVLQEALQKIAQVEPMGVQEAREALAEITGTLQRFDFRTAANVPRRM